ncbi:MAG: hypothetical protein ACLFPL_01400 [Candidatus Nanoarchaeia archaeon]
MKSKNDETYQLFENYLRNSKEHIQSLLNCIQQEQFQSELEICESDEKNICELYEVGANSPLIYIFSSTKYIQEIEEHRFKQLLISSAKTIKLMQAVKKAREKNNSLKLSISQITNELDIHSIQEQHKYVSHLLSLTHYLDWDIEKHQQDIENESYILFPHTFLLELKERFNLTNIFSIYEDEKIAIFLNARHEIISFFKDKSVFTNNDIKTIILPALKQSLNFKEISLKE